MGQAHFLPTTPDFNICPKIPGGKGPPGMLREGKRITARLLRTLLFLFSPRHVLFIVSSFNVSGVEDQQKFRIKNKLD